jgi:hypothetical protein
MGKEMICMELQQLEDKGLRAGARVLVELASRVVRAGIYLGTGASPVDPETRGVLLGIEREMRVVEWMDLGYVRDIQAALPPDA